MITSSSAVQPLNNLRSAAENIAGPDVKRHHRPLNRETLSSTNLAVGHTIWLLRGMAGHCCRRKRTTAVGRRRSLLYRAKSAAVGGERSSPRCVGVTER